MKDIQYIVIIICEIIVATGLRRSGRIYGGQDATPGQFPYMVALNDPTQYCNGIIIGPSWIITTAQCLFFFSPDAQVYVGSYMNQINGTSYKIRDIIVHGDFDGWSLINNIGLIHLNTALEYSDNVQAIELGGPPTSDVSCSVVGWGQTETEWTPENLKHVTVTVIDLELCRNLTAGNLNGYYLGLNQVCTVGGPGEGACWGDSGGGLICDGKLAGIVSYTVGPECGSGMPDVYTSIAAYADWIQQETLN